LPIIQQVYLSWSSILGYKFSAIDTLNFLDQKIPDYYKKDSNYKIIFKSELHLQSVSFRYNRNQKWILKDLNLTIKKGDRIGLIGTTGSGKSTLVDIIMGLLQPESGDVSVDGVKLNDLNLRNWQNIVSHVPQNIYISDNSILENIAFGIPLNNIDQEFVVECVKKARIFDVINAMPLKFDTIVGERGSKLSGGQRQRIGIARALYKRAEVLIFDEATNALDNETETEVMDSINSIDKNITLIMIAHRLSTLDKCNKIINVENGKIYMQDKIELN
jgi:ATP-binding cassette subfamily B protein